jgi:L-cysteine S-thiosulfotransferase
MRVLKLLVLLTATGASAASSPRSGYEYLTPETRVLQDDAFANPGMFWVEDGAKLWSQIPAADAPSCASCHGDASQSMRTVGTRYPAYLDKEGRVVNLDQRINFCRTEKQNQQPFVPESREALAISAYVMHQARGLPMSVSVIGPAAESYARGKAFFELRRGQLNLSCANCHEESEGRRLKGEVISQGQVNGFPVYRQLWQTVASANRMFAWCNEAVRAEPFAANSPEYVDLELYLRARGAGLKIETPAVRR